MNDYHYHYHFTTFDIETVDLENFKYNFVNMTAYRLVDADHPFVRLIMRDIEKFQPAGQNVFDKSNVIQVGPFLKFLLGFLQVTSVH